MKPLSQWPQSHVSSRVYSHPLAATFSHSPTATYSHRMRLCSGPLRAAPPFAASHRNRPSFSSQPLLPCPALRPGISTKLGWPPSAFSGSRRNQTRSTNQIELGPQLRRLLYWPGAISGRVLSVELLPSPLQHASFAPAAARPQ